MKITHASAQTLTDLVAEPEQQGDEWEAIAGQLDYWADLDKQYWQQRRENEYRAFLERKYGVIAQ